MDNSGQMATGWRAHKDGAPDDRLDGPYSWDELCRLAQTGGLQARDLVWHPSMSDWVPVAQVPGLLPRAMNAQAQQPPRATPRKNRRALIAGWVIAAIIVLAGLGVGLLFGLRGEDSDEATAPTTPTTSSADTSGTGSTTPTTASGRPLLGLADWSAPILLPVVGDSARVRDLTVHDETLIAVGVNYVGDVVRPAVWRSRDGVSWETIETVGLDLDGSSMTRVVSAGGWLAAIGEWSELAASGSKDNHAIGWTSADGVTWDRIDALPVTSAFDRATGLARIGDEVWIAGISYGRAEFDITDYSLGADGTVYGPDAPAELSAGARPFIRNDLWGTPSNPFLLRSSEGDTWVDVPLTGIEFAEPQVIGVGDDGAPILAGTDPDDRVAVWRRGEDGAWTKLPGLVPSSATSLLAVTGRDGIVVMTAYPFGAVLLRDGAWATLPGLTIYDLAILEDRFVGVGLAREGSNEDPVNHPYIVESLDGATWAAVELPSNNLAFAMTPFGDRLVAGGQVTNDDAQVVPAVWIGGSHDETVDGETLAPVDWQPPAVPDEPFADLLRFDGSSWVAELTNIDLGDAQIIRDLGELELDRATDLAVAGDGAVWVSTEQNGVYGLRDGQWTRYGVERGLPVESILQLAPGPGSTMVAATSIGLAVFDGAQFSVPALPAEISDPRVIDLVGDGTTVWAATASGLVSWDGTAWRRHGETEGLPLPDVVGGELPAGIALRLFPTDSGVAAELPGTRVATWDGSTWKVVDLPTDANVLDVGWDGSIVYGSEPDDVQRVSVFRRYPDGSEERLISRVQFSTAALVRDGTLFVTENLFGVYTIRDGSASRSDTLGGTKLGYVGRVWAVGDLAVLRGGSALFVYRDGTWTAHTAAVGLGYSLAGSDNSFSTGTIYEVAAGPDGAVWALSFQSLPEWIDQ